MIERFSHIGLCVPDLDQAVAFYRDVFGFTQLSSVGVRGAAADALLELPDVRLRAVFLERDGTRLELLSYRMPPVEAQSVGAMNRVGLTHLSFRVSDLDATVARVEKAGGKSLPHTRVEQAGTKTVFVLDPGNTRIELMECPLPADWLPGMPI